MAGAELATGASGSAVPGFPDDVTLGIVGGELGVIDSVIAADSVGGSA